MFLSNKERKLFYLNQSGVLYLHIWYIKSSLVNKSDVSQKKVIDVSPSLSGRLPSAETTATVNRQMTSSTTCWGQTSKTQKKRVFQQKETSYIGLSFGIGSLALGAHSSGWFHISNGLPGIANQWKSPDMWEEPMVPVRKCVLPACPTLYLASWPQSLLAVLSNYRIVILILITILNIIITIVVIIIIIVIIVRGAVVCPQLTCCIHQLWSIMPSQVGFALHVSKFRVDVFRVRVFLTIFF